MISRRGGGNDFFFFLDFFFVARFKEGDEEGEEEKEGVVLKISKKKKKKKNLHRGEFDDTKNKRKKRKYFLTERSHNVMNLRRGLKKDVGGFCAGRDFFWESVFLVARGEKKGGGGEIDLNINVAKPLSLVISVLPFITIEGMTYRSKKKKKRG